jgi:hypothetical protein
LHSNLTYLSPRSTPPPNVQQNDTHLPAFLYLFYTVQDLISKWRSVRDNYIRSLKKQAECNKSGSGRKRVQRYIFEEQLSFLKKNRELRPTTSSIQLESNEEDLDATQLSDNINVVDESLIDDNINNTNNAEKTISTPPPIKKKKINLEEKLALFLDSRQKQSNEPNQDTDDEDLNFYKSTLPLVKTFNMDQKMQFRIQLMQLLQRIKLTHNAPPYFQPPGPIFDPTSGVSISSLNHNYNSSIPMYPSTIQHTPMYNHDELSRGSIPNTATSPLSSNNSVTGYFSQFSPDEQNNSTSNM